EPTKEEARNSTPKIQGGGGGGSGGAAGKGSLGYNKHSLTKKNPFSAIVSKTKRNDSDATESQLFSRTYNSSYDTDERYSRNVRTSGDVELGDMGTVLQETTIEIKSEPMCEVFPGKFYALSLAHHPDKNRDNPAASKEYSHISAAYNTLSDDGARAKYDRDHAIGPSAAQRAAANGRRKTHVGARPASGLSKRRSPFTGPPPSFYSSGGYGGTGRRTPRPPYSGRKPGETRPTEPDPAEFVKRNEVPHFDAESHLRTQQNQDERRRQRRAENLASGAKRRGDVADNDVGGSEPRRFVLLSGVIIFAAVVTAWMGTTANEKRNENRKKQQQQQRRKEKEEQGEEVGKSET
ncbi:hypothetical protein KEM55_005910, partial [Ascosphaera atra]